MAIVFNDLGDPSNDPCGVTIGNLCGASNYSSWFRTAQILDGTLAVIAIAADADIASKVKATSLRTQFLLFPAGGSLSVSFFPIDKTHAIARWVQDTVDFLTGIADEGRPLPPSLFTPPPGAGSGGLAFISTGVVVGAVAAAAALYYFTRKGRRGR